MATALAVAIVDRLVSRRNEGLERGARGSWGNQFRVHSIGTKEVRSRKSFDRYHRMGEARSRRLMMFFEAPVVSIYKPQKFLAQAKSIIIPPCLIGGTVFVAMYLESNAAF